MEMMSSILAVLLVVCLCSEGLCCKHSLISGRMHDYCLFDSDDVDVKIDDGRVLIINRDEDETIEITEAYELYIDDRHIELDEGQRELVGEYYNRILNITSYAKMLGIEGAKLGASGVKLGFTAIAKVAKLALSSYDRYDLEEDMEREAEKLERKAQRLERKAERIEEMAEELVDLHYELKESVPALRDVDWF
jgi:hypothetical protein